MNYNGFSTSKANKFCLLIFRNKNLNDFSASQELLDSFASIGYYFDKISYVAYDDSGEIVHAINDAKSRYENIVMLCPFEMDSLLKSFVSALYKAKFDGEVLNTDGNSVFIRYYDAENKIGYAKLGEILSKKYGTTYSKSYIRLVGAAAKKIHSALDHAKAVCPSLTFNISVNYADCRIEIVCSDYVPKHLKDEAIRVMVEELNDHIYALEDISLAERLYQLLKLRNYKISVAESFTGGGISRKLVEIPGISDVYFEGLNTYSNESKMKRLNVKDGTLRQYTAVSEKTAREMAEGLISSGDCDICLATTGLAGPKGLGLSKPVGLVYLAVGTKESITVFSYNLKGDRNFITNTAINFALFLAYKTLK